MKQSLTKLVCISMATLLASCSSTHEGKTSSEHIQVVLKSQVKWQHLNPARGDKAPQAGTLWGNRQKDLATGFLLKPKDGFRSPPHIHNVSYRGVVITGQIHNDDPKAMDSWMTTGSYWTQPKGEPHITAAKGNDTLAYIEIERGPYLVKPVSQQFDDGERALNVHANNLVWLDSSQSSRLSTNSKAEISFLWGQPNQKSSYGSLIKLPAGFDGVITAKGTEFRAVVIQGDVGIKQKNKTQTLALGSYFAANKNADFRLQNASNNKVILYVRTNGEFNLN